MKILFINFLVILFFSACAQNNMSQTEVEDTKVVKVEKDEMDDFDKADAEFDREMNKAVSSKRIIKDLSCKLK